LSLASVARYKAHCVADNVDHSSWSGDAGCVVDDMHLCLCLHASRHIALRLRNYHPIVFGDQKPSRNVLPKRTPARNSNAVDRYRPLHSRKHCALIRRCVLRERSREGLVGKPNQPIAVGCKLWRLGMGFEAVEHVRDLLALIGSK
jgi:hypothetical protein